MSGGSQTGFTHFDETGTSHMVDVSEKQQTNREATAEAFVCMKTGTKIQIQQQAMKKGDVLGVSELAGIMAAKKTSELIPLCHPLPITKVSVKCDWVTRDDAWSDAAESVSAESRSADDGLSVLRIRSTVKTTYLTGVEMEALTACSVAALTVYDMCKAVDKDMTIESICLLHKAGGKSGTYQRPDTGPSATPFGRT